MSGSPKVSVLTPTYCRPASLPDAIRSVINQDLTDWEMLVINDGGTDVRHVVESFGDERVIYIDRPVNTGKAACLNCGLERARGDYIAYLDDDDVWYPNHLALLARALDERCDVGVAYSDLYRVVCIADAGGRRFQLQKRVEICRDYNRMFMFHFNHTLHVSLMHSRELGLHVGGYDESVRVLIDWDMTRKLSFYTDFVHVPCVTGEYYAPVGNSDRISDVQRRDRERYLQNLRRIRADLPPEPWPKVRKVAVIFPMSRWDEGEVHVVRYLADRLDYPCRIVLVNRAPALNEHDCRRALGDMGELAHLQIAGAAAGASLDDAYRAGVRSLDADCYYLPTPSLDTEAEVRLIRGIEFLEEAACAAVRWQSDGDSDYDVLIRGSALREGGAGLPTRAADTRTVPTDWAAPSLATDLLLCFATRCEEDGNYAGAKAMLDEVAAIGHGGLGSPYLVQRYAQVAFRLGEYDEAERMCRDLIDRGYGADNWLRLGQMAQRARRYEEAIDAYRRAFDGLGLTMSDLERAELRLVGDSCDPFIVMAGVGECLVELGRHEEAAPILRRAATLRGDSPRPALAFGRMFLKEGDLARAEQALKMALSRGSGEQGAAVQARLAEVYERQGRLSAAYWACRNAMSTEPDNIEHAERAVRLAGALDRADDGEQILRELLAHRPGHVPGLRALAEICRSTGRQHEADGLAERADLLATPG